MKKQHTQMAKGFCAGLLAAGLIAGSGLPARALSELKQINVSMGGITIFVDGKLQSPTDVNGKPVEPMIYDGTTYLPVRAMVGMLSDKKVDWDSKNQRVIIGTNPSAGQVRKAEELMRYDSGVTKTPIASTGKDAQFSILGELQTPFNRLNGGIRTREMTTKLDGGYTDLKGTFVIPYDDLNAKRAGKLCVYSVDKNGVKTLLESYEAKAGDAPQDVEVNLRGCDFIMIRTENTTIGDFTGDYGVLYDVTFTTAG